MPLLWSCVFDCGLDFECGPPLLRKTPALAQTRHALCFKIGKDKDGALVFCYPIVLLADSVQGSHPHCDMRHNLGQVARGRIGAAPVRALALGYEMRGPRCAFIPFLWFFLRLFCRSALRARPFMRRSKCPGCSGWRGIQDSSSREQYFGWNT